MKSGARIKFIIIGLLKMLRNAPLCVGVLFIMTCLFCDTDRRTIHDSLHIIIIVIIIIILS